jgi:hypothetical protein
MRRALAPFSKLESSNHTQSSADFITNTSGFSFRYTQPRMANIVLGLPKVSNGPLETRRPRCFNLNADKANLPLHFVKTSSACRLAR